MFFAPEYGNILLFLNHYSDITGISTVSTEGVVTAVKEGKATITVTTVDGAKKATCEVTVKAEEQPDELMQFVTRMYTKALQRDGDEAGIKSWYDMLKAGTLDAATMASFFLVGEEIGEQNITDEEFVNYGSG